MKMQQNLALEGCLGKAGRDGATPEPGRRAARPSPADAARRLELGQLRRPKTASLVEGLTLVLLVCVAVPLRHPAGWPVVTAVMGPVHGLAFLFYVWTVLETAAGGGWMRRDVARLLLVAFVPFAGFANLAFIRRRPARLSRPGV